MRAGGAFSSNLSTCPYLRDRPCQMVMRTVEAASAREHGALLEAGVRHFGRLYFRPSCPGCEECVSIRVPVARFRPSKSQRRVLARNADLDLEVGDPRVDEERLDLFRRFHADREARRGWKPVGADGDAYEQMLVTGPARVHEFRYRLGGRLVAVGYADESAGALSSIYGFWDPEHRRRSLGTFDVLSEIQTARTLGLEHLYLGYCVAGCMSLEYKRSFRPFELLAGGRWTPVEAT